MIASHTDWSTPDPFFKGEWDLLTTSTVVLNGAGVKTFEVDSCNGSAIYHLFVDATSAPSPYNLKIFDKSARATEDLVFQTTVTTGDYTHVQNNSKSAIIYVDRDKVGKIWCQIVGGAGETLEITWKILRLF